MASALDHPPTGSDETKKRRPRSLDSSGRVDGESAVKKPRSDVMRDYFSRRKMAGEKRVTVWLSKRGREALARLQARHGSNDKAVEACLIHCDEADKEPASS